MINMAKWRRWLCACIFKNWSFIAVDLFLHRFVTAVYPSLDDDVITSPYNSVLAMRQLTENADCVLPVENQVYCSIHSLTFWIVRWPQQANFVRTGLRTLTNILWRITTPKTHSVSIFQNMSDWKPLLGVDFSQIYYHRIRKTFWRNRPQQLKSQKPDWLIYLVTSTLTENFFCLLQALVDIVNKIYQALPPDKFGKRVFGSNVRVKKASALTASEGCVTRPSAEKPFDGMNNVVANMLLNLTRYKNRSQNYLDNYCINMTPTKRSSWKISLLLARRDSKDHWTWI